VLINPGDQNLIDSTTERPGTPLYRFTQRRPWRFIPLVCFYSFFSPLLSTSHPPSLFAKLALSTDPWSTLCTYTSPLFNQQSRLSCPGSWSHTETPPHVVLGWVVPVRTVACAGIDAGLQVRDEDAGQIRSLIADTTEDLKGDVGGAGDVGRCSQKRGKERREGRTECEWRYWVWEGRTGEGAARRPNEVLRSGDEVPAVGLEDGVTELGDVVGDEVAILVPGSVASNTLLGVDFPTGGCRAGAGAGDSYSDYSQD